MGASKLQITAMTAADWPAVAAIYREGIATGHATFTPAPPDSFAGWSESKVAGCSLVACDAGAPDGIGPSADSTSSPLADSTGSLQAGSGRPRPDSVVGWACLTPVSDRCVYAGVAEVSVYVAAAARGRGVGDALMADLIERSEVAGIWTLQAGIFPENQSSIALHMRHGFRQVGRRERIGKMTHGPCAGQWRDTLLLERRSAVAGG